MQVKYKRWGDNDEIQRVTILLVGAISFAGIGWYRNYQSDTLKDKCNRWY